jgi:hypothetical protein
LHRAKGQITFGVLQQALTEVHQRRRMKTRVREAEVQGQFPAQVVFDQLDGLAVGHPFQELEN